MRFLLACFCLLLPLSAAAQTQADEAALWAALRDGGDVALIRHALAPGTGDPPGFRVDDCRTQRNLSDEQIQKIAANGGIIGIAFFDMAVGEPELPNIIASIKHVRDLVGVEYVALGSDYDGSVAVPFDITGLPLIVEGLMNAGFSEAEIRAVMGENVKNFFLKNLK